MTSPDAMTVRLYLRRIRVIAVLVDLIEAPVVEIAAGWRVPRNSQAIREIEVDGEARALLKN